MSAQASAVLARWLSLEHGALPVEEAFGALSVEGLFERCVSRWQGTDLRVDAFLEDAGGDGALLALRAEALRHALEAVAARVPGRIRAAVWVLCGDAARVDALRGAYLGHADGHFLSKVLVGRGLLSVDGAAAAYAGRSPARPGAAQLAAALRDPTADPGEGAAEQAQRLRREDERQARRLLQSGPLPLTWAIIVANIAVYGWQLSTAQQLGNVGLAPDRAWSETLLRLGANQAAWTLGHHQYWRILASAFLHENVVHLGMNMAALYSLGSLVERLAGPWRMALLYLLAAVLAGLGSLLLLPGGGISLGASGAILGLAGLLLAPRWRRHPAFPQGLAQRLYDWLARPLLLLFAIGIGLQLLDLPIQLDNGAHLGGLLCGFILGYVYPSYLVRRERRKP